MEGNVHHNEGVGIYDELQGEEVHDGTHPRQPYEREPYAHENREDAVREKKGFSLPAVAVQMVVCARCANKRKEWRE